MAVIKDIEEIKELIPKFKDLARCGNFASVKDEIIKAKPLYAFSINGIDGITTKHFKAKFYFLGLSSVYALVLAGENALIGRYCDYVAIPRDITKPVGYKDWKWSTDDIGLSFRSDNASHNFVYFGTDENDGDEIIEGLKNGFRHETIYKPIDQGLKNMVMESLKIGKPTNRSMEAKRESAIIVSKEELITKPNPAISSFDMSKCLPAPSNAEIAKQTILGLTAYGSVLERFIDKKFGTAPDKEDKKTESIVVADVVYV